MKKILSNQILFIFILFITMGCGCEKDPIEPDYPMEINTVADLNGTWEFVSFDYPGIGYFTPSTLDCGNLPSEMSVLSLLLSFDFNSSTETATLTDECKGVYVTNKNYELLISPFKIIRIKDPANFWISYNIENYDEGVLTLSKSESGSVSPTILTVRLTE